MQTDLSINELKKWATALSTSKARRPNFEIQKSIDAITGVATNNAALAQSIARPTGGINWQEYMCTRGDIIIETSSACASKQASCRFICRRGETACVCKCNNFILGSTLTSFILIIHGRARNAVEARGARSALLAPRSLPHIREKNRNGAAKSTDTPFHTLISFILQVIKMINVVNNGTGSFMF